MNSNQWKQKIASIIYRYTATDIWDDSENGLEACQLAAIIEKMAATIYDRESKIDNIREMAVY